MTSLFLSMSMLALTALADEGQPAHFTITGETDQAAVELALRHAQQLIIDCDTRYGRKNQPIDYATLTWKKYGPASIRIPLQELNIAGLPDIQNNRVVSCIYNSLREIDLPEPTAKRSRDQVYRVQLDFDRARFLGSHQGELTALKTQVSELRAENDRLTVVNEQLNQQLKVAVGEPVEKRAGDNLRVVGNVDVDLLLSDLTHLDPVLASCNKIDTRDGTTIEGHQFDLIYFTLRVKANGDVIDCGITNYVQTDQASFGANCMCENFIAAQLTMGTSDTYTVYYRWIADGEPPVSATEESKSTGL